MDPIAQPAPTDGRPSRWQAPRSPAFETLLVYLALAVLHFRLTWAAPREATIGGRGDPWLFVWFLKWDQLAVAHAHSPLLSHDLNVPAGVNLMWNTSVILPGVLLAGVTATLGPVFTYNLLVTLALPLSAWAACLVFRRYVTSQLAAGVGGLVYGFSPYMLAHALGHLQLILAITPPLMLTLVDEILVRQRASAVWLGVALGALAAAQLLTAEELLASELLAATGALALLALLHPRRVRAHAPYAGKALGTAAVVGLLLVAWPLRVQFLGPEHPHTPIQGRGVAVTDLANFVVPTGLQRFTSSAAVAISDHFAGNGTEWDGYLGLPLLLLLGGVMVRWWRRPLVRVASLLALGLAIASLGPRLRIAGHLTRVRLPWRAVQAVPVLYDVLPNRLMLYVFLLAGLLVALFADAVLGTRNPRRVVLGIVALALALLPLLPRSPAPSTPLAVPPFFASRAVRHIPPGSVVLVAPFAHYPPTVAPMLWQAVSATRFRMPEGYFVGADAAGRAQFGPSATPLSRAMEAIQAGRPPPSPAPAVHAVLVRILRDWRVRTVLVGPMGHQATMAGFFTTLLGRPPTLVGGVLAWWGVGHAEPAGLARRGLSWPVGRCREGRAKSKVRCQARPRSSRTTHTRQLHRQAGSRRIHQPDPEIGIHGSCGSREGREPICSRSKARSSSDGRWRRCSTSPPMSGTSPATTPHMRRAEQLTDGPLGVGTRFLAEIASMRRTVPMVTELTAYQRPHRYASTTHLSLMDTRGTVTFEPVPEGTLLRWAWQVEPRGAFRLTAPIMARIGRRQERAIWAGLKRVLEEQSTPPAQT